MRETPLSLLEGRYVGESPRPAAEVLARGKGPNDKIMQISYRGLALLGSSHSRGAQKGAQIAAPSSVPSGAGNYCNNNSATQKDDDLCDLKVTKR